MSVTISEIFVTIRDPNSLIDYKEIYKQAFYYAFGHFSRFITPNSTRVDLISPDKNVWAVAFKRTDGHMVAVVYNK